jgi:hypothetical protein
VRPPSVLREETRVRCGVFSFAAGLIILSRPRLPRARSPRLAGGGGHVERSGISTCARAPASPSVDKPCRAGGNADNAVVAARVLHPTDAREGIKGLSCLRPLVRQRAHFGSPSTESFSVPTVTQEFRPSIARAKTETNVARRAK